MFTDRLLALVPDATFAAEEGALCLLAIKFYNTIVRFFLLSLESNDSHKHIFQIYLQAV